MSVAAGNIPHERSVRLHTDMIAGDVTRLLSRRPSKAYATTELVCGIHNTSPSYWRDTLKVNKLMASV